MRAALRVAVGVLLLLVGLELTAAAIVAPAPFVGVLIGPPAIVGGFYLIVSRRGQG